MVACVLRGVNPAERGFLDKGIPCRCQVCQDYMANSGEILDVEYLVVGHPRSGTGYVAQVLQSCGLDVGHERLGRDGISHWQLSYHQDFIPYLFKLGRNRLNVRKIIHVVRNPFRVVESVYYTENREVKSTMFREKILPELRTYRLSGDMLGYSIYSVIWWNRGLLISGTDLKVRVEGAEDAVPAWFKLKYVKTPPPHDVNKREHGTVDMKSHPLYPELCEYAKRLGYEIPS